MSKPNVFIKKKDDETTENIVLSKEEVLNSIPKSATEKCNKELALTHNEYRWRIIKLPDKNKEFVEISMKPPNKNRLFMSQNTSWIEHDQDNVYDQFVIKSYFYYAKG